MHIIGIAETKIAESSNHKLYLANPYYEIYTANSNEKPANKQKSSMGSALAVLKTLQLYINNILKLAETTIAVDFFSSRNQRIRIISVYLTMTNKKLNKKTQKTVVEWTQQVIAREYNVVIIGTSIQIGLKKRNYYHCSRWQNRLACQAY
ncbi:hypothetical protein F8M41_006526 [Gigaspora margarita]|uniref:Uncharacterized protein n=1 Tax=Gigaspora margarita TaxID=4874 RepID=A0A8H4AWQ2_GIGMA|nr:hypothetical protein F8M41_006526 [Gigaspora margarita]